MSNGARRATVCGISAAAFVALSAAARSWSGDLTPSPLWLATAAVTAIALISTGDRPWAIVGGAIGGVVSGLWVYDDTLRNLISPVAANTLEMVIVVVLVTRLLPAGPTIRRTRDGLIVLAIAIVAASVSGLVAIADTASTVIGSRFESWWRWTVGDAIGQLLLVPIALTFRLAFITSPIGRHRTEIVATCVGVVGLGIVAFWVDSPVLYVIAPLVLWLAIRFGPRLTAPIAVIAAVAATAATGRGHGPFATLGDDPVVQVQLFNLSVALSSLVGGAHAVRADRDHDHLAAVLSSLPDIVLVRGAGGEVVDAWVPDGLHPTVAELAPEASASAVPMVDDPIEQGPRAVLTTMSGAVFERRTAPLDDRRSIEVYRDISTEQEALKDLRRREEIAEDSRLAEQARIAREIHDSPLQLLAAAKLRVEAANDTAPDPNLARAVDLMTEALKQLRGQVITLMPPDVEAGHVVEALEHLAHRIVDPLVRVDTTSDVDVEIGPDDSITLFLVGREAISNAARHAAASRITIALTHVGGQLELVIADDGVGRSDLDVDRKRIGLALMRDRITERGGDMDFRQRAGHGTTVTFRLPVAS